MKWNWVAIFVGFTVLVLAVLGYALITMPGDEGFLKDHGVELRWNLNRLPVVCIYEPEVSAELVAEYEKSREFYAEAVGRNVFQSCSPWLLRDKALPDRAPRGAVVLRIRDERLPDDSAGAYTNHSFDPSTGEILAADIRFNWDLALEAVGIVVRHEMGHVLGLDHDTVPGSLMVRRPYGMKRHLTDDDRGRLRSAYQVGERHAGDASADLTAH